MKMSSYLWTILLILLVANICTSSKDLLDDYVRHVEESSRLHTNVDSLENNGVEFKDMVNRVSIMGRKLLSTDKNMSYKPDAIRTRKAFRNRMMLKKLIQMTKTEKKHRIKKRSIQFCGFFNDDRLKQNQPSRRTKRIPMQWTHNEILDKKGDVVLRWQPRHQEISFRLEAKTKGYVGIGFSPSGGMKDADIVIGWVDDFTGQAHLLDCHASNDEANSRPIKDEIENYTLMRGTQNDTHTILEFRRALDTCDSEDYVLGTDTVRVIWALHDADPRRGDIHHHTQRGEQSLYLLGPPTVNNPEATRNWDVTLKNFAMPETVETYYWCKIFKGPTLNSKHHIVSYEPMLGENHRPHLHHMVIHECKMPSPSNDMVLEFEKASQGEGAECYGPDMPQLWEHCSTPLVAWGLGSKGETLPQHVGIPLAESVPKYYMLEIYFDNPNKKRAVDTSGLRLHYTHLLRKHDAGIIAAGVAPTSLHIVPPKQPEYKSAGYCSTDCTKEMFPKEGINVVSILLHTHLTGKKMNLRHIRGGRELAPIVQDNKYDYYYQQTRMLSQEVTILPGDGLITECTYSTLDRPKPTLGGYSTHNEMCLAFILHYPRSELKGCYSMPPIKFFFEIFGVQEFYNKDMSQLVSEQKLISTNAKIQMPRPPYVLPTFPPGLEDNEEANLKFEQAIRQARDYTIEGEDNYINYFDALVIKEPQEFRNKTFMSHLNEIPWREELLTKRIEESFYKGQHLGFCRKRNDVLAYHEKIETLPNFTNYVDHGRSKLQCSYRLQHGSYSIANQIRPLSAILILLVVLMNR